METSVKQLPTIAMAQAGTSPWLDSISRELLRTGELRKMIDEKGILGVTSNPSIFEKAISDKNGGYDSDIRKMFKAGESMLSIYDELTTTDVRNACDLFKKVIKDSKHEHGFVSLEVRPDLAHDMNGTVADALRLVKKIKRSNVMIKVPATPAGVDAFRELTARGVNVNVTLIFSKKQYLDVLHAYVDGLEMLHKSGGDVSAVHSVASVFVSRYDVYVDAKLSELEQRESDKGEKAALKALQGKAALANCKVIYDEFEKVCSGKRFQKLKAAGANAQKVLWASTGVKNPAYSDLLYVESLIGPETVNTMPDATVKAVLDHGNIASDTVSTGVGAARETLKQLDSWGIDLVEIGNKLQHDGLIAFEKSFDDLMKTIELHCEAAKGKVKSAKFKFTMPKALKDNFPARLMRKEKVLERFLAEDASLWKSDQEHQAVINNRLGWIRVADSMLGGMYVLDELKASLKKDKIKDIVLLGMGGSSLAPEVMSLISAKTAKIRFQILDSTDPAAIRNIESKLDLKKTLFIVASKSGTTVETTSQYQYFRDRVSKLYKGVNSKNLTGRHFVAITDDGSALQEEAYAHSFRKVFVNPSNIGGRYSALSFFGLVPAALMGVDARLLLKQARELLSGLETVKDASKDDSFVAGVLLGELAQEGKDKLTILASRKLQSFGSWLEQLIAESTGKEERGILPVDGEAAASPKAYGDDRVFLVLKLSGEKNEALDQKVKALKKVGYPVIESVWPDESVLGAEFLRWEIVTSIAGSILGVNPFDEPNVKESKNNTTRLLSQLDKDGRLKQPENYVSAAKKIDFSALFESLKGGEYFASLAFIERNAKAEKLLSRIQNRLRDVLQTASLRGFGPRYLHSIGQFYKGGPQKGRFICFVQNDGKDLKIPGAKFSFSQLKQAQAFGDIKAITDRDRPCLTVDLGRDPLKGLEAFDKQLAAYLKK